VSVMSARLARFPLLHCHPLKRFSQTFTQNMIPVLNISYLMRMLQCYTAKNRM
jgi:hypothetical protein